ncbi:U3 snoRNP protein Nop14 [Schizosaccharomyces japonicus yFS275]|uniref:U3 snoRNP protein Nop14 n=1 Tax=Schizosaccharomyces japonicus (strain yFS275 / FY16936) TaxID=402676 RepID=B6K4U1_SCHJY|nr:U3 snoRNP protein Nop14 [Schizosaccharomyces japonicus yFS275]EEB08498.1 U3 snoRNP protein Nop14 [Schizosaccharomyces japonicus yFS275]
MAGKGSQLKNLKQSIRQTGVFDARKGKKHVRQRGSMSREERASKLDKIHSDFNRFDRQYTRQKFEIINKKTKGTEGRPGISRGVGEEIRKRTIGEKLKRKNRTGAIVDRRFGENNPLLTPEEKMLQRFSLEQKRQLASSELTLADEEVLTHGSRPLSELETLDDHARSDDDMDMDGEIVRRAHFGGFDEDEEEDEGGERKKTKHEVMQEIIAKSKRYKAERQAEKEQLEEEREKLDEEMDDIQSLLSNYARETRKSAGKEVKLEPTKEDVRYDAFVREMVFDRRARPSERTKTEEEIAQAEADRLRELEEQRLQRMHNAKAGYADGREGDSLEDDYVPDETDNVFGFGEGLTAKEDDEESFTGFQSGSESEESADDEVDDEATHKKSSKGKTVRFALDEKPSRKNGGKKELAYTYECPLTHAHFLDMLDGLNVEDHDTVITRIRTLHHMKLHPENKGRLEKFAIVLVKHILYLSTQQSIPFGVINQVAQHLMRMAETYSLAIANTFRAVLTGMQKRLADSYADSEVTFPANYDLVFLNTIPSIFPTSDLKHPVVSPAMLIMAESISQSKCQTLADWTRKMFLVNLFVKYQRISKRYVPETLNAIAQLLVVLSPVALEKAPGAFPLTAQIWSSGQKHEFGIQDISLDAPTKISLNDLGTMEALELQSSLLLVVLNLVKGTADLFNGQAAYLEMFEPILSLLGIYTENEKLLHPELAAHLHTVHDHVSKLVEKARELRKPLQLQQHRPIAISAQLPKFEERYTVEKHDMDAERNELNKLRAQHRDARRGAIRTLRRDAQFVARERSKEQREKTKAYNEKMRKLENRLQHFDSAV